MGFFNSLLIRVTLAAIGGIFYALLIYTLLMFVSLSSSLATVAAFFVYLLYIGSRFLLLFSGIDSPYYSKGREGSSKTPNEKHSFCTTAQWVGKFYHQHDRVLFVFLGVLSIIFLISLVMDGWGEKPFGNTIQNLWNALIPMS